MGWRQRNIHRLIWSDETVYRTIWSEGDAILTDIDDVTAIKLMEF